MGAFADIARSTKGTSQTRASAKDDDQPEVIEVSKTDFTVDVDESGEIITLTIFEQDYALDLDTAGDLADSLNDANPATESPEQD